MGDLRQDAAPAGPRGALRCRRDVGPGPRQPITLRHLNALRTSLFAAARAVSKRSYFRGRDRLTTALLAAGQSLGPPVTLTVDGLDLTVDLRETTGQWIWRELRLPHEVRWLSGLCEPGDTIVDVGANIGYTSLAAARAAGPEGRVVAIEPTRKAFHLLERNVALSEGAPIVPLQLAAGADHGVVRIHVPKRSSDRSSLVADGALGRAREEIVELRTLRSICAELGATPDVVKVDVEGAEWPVLRGMLPEIAPRALFVETCEPNTRSFGYQPSEMCRWLQEHGYSLRLVYAPEDRELPYSDETVDAFKYGDVIATRGSSAA